MDESPQKGSEKSKNQWDSGGWGTYIPFLTKERGFGLEETSRRKVHLLPDNPSPETVSTEMSSHKQTLPK